MAPELKTRRVLVTPTPGFVIKTTTIQSGYYTVPSPSSPPPDIRHAVTAGLKVFVNVTYSADIPPPPTASLPAAEEDEIIGRAMDGDIESTYFVPVVVSSGRPDKDKAGKPCLVFDAFLNNTLRSRMTKDFNFRSFVLEIILSHIESPPLESHSRALSLSRTLSMPNISFKGKPDPRQLDVPDFGEPRDPGSHKPPKPLIEEITTHRPTSNKAPKSILKAPGSRLTEVHRDFDPHTKTDADSQLETPVWKWQDSNRIIIEVPKLVRDDHPRCALFASEDILTLRTPSYFLQIPIDSNNLITVEKMRAEWRIGEGRIILTVT